MLRIINLTKYFGGIKAVDNVTIDFKPGKITSLIGPNGAGKSTIFNLINGFLRPDHGEVILDSTSICPTGSKNIRGEIKLHKMKPYEIAQIGIGRLFQDVRNFKKLNCLDNLIMGSRDIKGEKLIETLMHFQICKKVESELKKEAIRYLQLLGLEERQNAFAEDLSFGEQKLISLARLLLGKYDVLLLDEPTAGINPFMIERILDLIIKAAKEMHKTVILIEHNMNVVYRVSDWIYFINNGALSAFGLPDEVLNDPEVRKIYIGL